MPIFTAETDAAVEKTESEVSPTDIERVRKFVAEVRRGRLDWEVQCFVNEMMKKGRHYVNDKGVVDSRDPHQLRRPVNKFRTMLRRIKNAVTFNDPVVDVLPETGQEDKTNQEELDVASWLCVREYKMNNMRNLVKQAVETAALKTWALISCTPNDGDDYLTRLTSGQTYDSLDVFFQCADQKKNQLLVISSLESKEWLEENGYDVKNATTATNSSHSLSKNRLDRMVGKRGLDGMYLIDQVFAVEHERGTDDKIKPDTKKVVHYVLCGDNKLTPKKQLVGYKCLDELFHVLYLESDEFDPYNPPWMTDVVPLQRSLNDSSENADTILHAHAKARFKQRRSDTNNLTMLENRHMQILEYEGAAPEAMEYPQPPPALFQMMQTREQQIENQIGQHGPSMGEGKGISSGRHAALIQAGDQDNVKEPSDNVEAMLAWYFTRTLDVGAHYIDEVMKIYSPDEGKLEKSIIGDLIDEKKAEEEGEEPKEKAVSTEVANVVKVKPFTNIKAKVIPGSFFTLAQAKSDFMEMLPIMNQLGFQVEAKAAWKVMMRMMNVGLSRDISRMVEEEQNKSDFQDADYKIAELEFLKMSNGEAVTATPEQDHMAHLRVKVPGLQAIAAKYGKQNDAYVALGQNIAQHWQMMKANESGKDVVDPAVMQKAEASMAGGQEMLPPEAPAPTEPTASPATAAPGGALPLPVG